MPCFDAEAAAEQRDSVGKLAVRDAMLCAVMTVLDDQGLLDEVLAHVDSQQAGVTDEEIRQWYQQHLAEDAARNASSSPGIR